MTSLGNNLPAQSRTDTVSHVFHLSVLYPVAAMETSIEDMASLVRGLEIADNEVQGCEREPLRSAWSHPSPLNNTINMLIEFTNAINAQGRSIRSLADGLSSYDNLPFTELRVPP